AHVWDRQWELVGLIWGGNLGEGQLEGAEIVKLQWDKRTARQQDDLLDYFLNHGSIVDAKRFAELKLADLQTQLTALKKEYPQAQATRGPVMRSAVNPRQTFIHDRGDFRTPGARVATGTPEWLPSRLTVLPTSGSNGVTTEPSRLELARWLVSRDNPL